MQLIYVNLGTCRVNKLRLALIYNHSKLKLFDKLLTLHRFRRITFVGSYLNCFEVSKNYSIYAQADRTERTRETGYLSGKSHSKTSAA